MFKLRSGPVSARASRFRWLVIAAFATCAVGYYVWGLWNPPQLRIALPVNQIEHEAQFIWPASRGWPGTDFLPLIWKLDEEQGIQIKPHHALAGKSTMDALFSGKADIAIVSTAVLVDAITRGEPLQILACTTISKNQIKIIARRENVHDWLTKPIAMRYGTTYESVLIAQLQASGRLDLFTQKRLALINIDNPRNLIASLLDGSVKAAGMIRPHADYATTLVVPGQNVPFVDVTLPGVYQMNTYLVTTAQRWKDARRVILKGLTAMKQSRVIARQDPARALNDIRQFEAAGNTSMAALPHAWKIDELVFLTKKADIQPGLEVEAQLRRAGGLLQSIPDFSKHMSLLDEVTESMEAR